MRFSRSLRALTVPLVAFGLLAAGCGGDDSPEGGPCDVKVSGDLGKKPSITVPDGCAAPSTLVSTDLHVGDGPAITSGATAEIHYTLVNYTTKEALESSYDGEGKPYAVQNVGQANVIEGWNEGLIGMKQGGRRLLVVPPDKAYANSPASGLQNATLVFVLDAVTVTPPN